MDISSSGRHSSFDPVDLEDGFKDSIYRILLLGLHPGPSSVRFTASAKLLWQDLLLAILNVSFSTSSTSFEKYSCASCCCQLLMLFNSAGVHNIFPAFNGSLSFEIRPLKDFRVDFTSSEPDVLLKKSANDGKEAKPWMTLF